MVVVLKKDYFGQKAGTTLDIDEPHTKSLLDQGIVEAVKVNPYGPLMAKAVEASIAALTKNIDQAITAAVQQIALAQTKSRKNAVPEIFGPGGEGDPRKNFGDFCVTVARKDYAFLEKHNGSAFNAWQTKELAGMKNLRYLRLNGTK